MGAGAGACAGARGGERERRGDVLEVRRGEGGTSSRRRFIGDATTAAKERERGGGGRLTVTHRACGPCRAIWRGEASNPRPRSRAPRGIHSQADLGRPSWAEAGRGDATARTSWQRHPRMGRPTRGSPASLGLAATCGPGPNRDGSVDGGDPLRPRETGREPARGAVASPAAGAGAGGPATPERGSRTASRPSPAPADPKRDPPAADEHGFGAACDTDLRAWPPATRRAPREALRRTGDRRATSMKSAKVGRDGDEQK